MFWSIRDNNCWRTIELDTRPSGYSEHNIIPARYDDERNIFIYEDGSFATRELIEDIRRSKIRMAHVEAIEESDVLERIR